MSDNYYGMPVERYDFLMEATGPCVRLTEEEMKQGWHFCGDWDDLLIHVDGVEFNHCHCKHMEHFRTEERKKAQAERKAKCNEALNRLAMLDEELGLDKLLREMRDDPTI